MISAKVTVDTDVLDAIREAAAKSPRLLQTALKRRLTRVKSRLLDELRTEPDKPTYPLRWKSQRQRIFVIAKLRREGNLPYKRTGKYLSAFKVSEDTDTDSGVLAVENATPYARFVGGDDQQPMHIDTGWTFVPPVIAKYREIAENELIDVWFTVVDGAI